MASSNISIKASLKKCLNGFESDILHKEKLKRKKAPTFFTWEFTIELIEGIQLSTERKGFVSGHN